MVFGTSEVEHVLATQCLVQKKSRTMLIAVEGRLGKGVTAKDVALAIIGDRHRWRYRLRYRIWWLAIRGLSMEGRITCATWPSKVGHEWVFVAV